MEIIRRIWLKLNIYGKYKVNGGSSVNILKISVYWEAMDVL